jgi:hypothetical protein
VGIVGAGRGDGRVGGYHGGGGGHGMDSPLCTPAALKAGWWRKAWDGDRVGKGGDGVMEAPYVGIIAGAW